MGFGTAIAVPNNNMSTRRKYLMVFDIVVLFALLYFPLSLSAEIRPNPRANQKESVSKWKIKIAGDVWDWLRSKKKFRAGSSVEQDSEVEEEVVEDESEETPQDDSEEALSDDLKDGEDESDEQDENEDDKVDDTRDHVEKAETGNADGEDVTTIASLEENVRTFESLAEGNGTLLLWGSYSTLYAAQIDLFGEVLIPAKKIASTENHITGIAKPIRWKGDWLIAIRETDLQNRDQIRLIQLDEAGDVAHDSVWLKDFERISLPVFFPDGKNLKAAYFASQPQNAGLYFAGLGALKKIPAAKQIRSFEGGVAYPPILEGAVYDDAFAILLHYRSKKPPPMKFFLVDQSSGNVLKDADIAHEGGAVRLSKPAFQIIAD